MAKAQLKMNDFIPNINAVIAFVPQLTTSLGRSTRSPTLRYCTS